MALSRKYRFPLGREKVLGKTHPGIFFNLVVSKEPVKKRFAFVCGTKISKKAVERNKIKRQLAQAVWELWEEFRPGDYIFYAKKTLLGKAAKEVKEEVKSFNEKNFKKLNF